jgi:endonuclease G, mitochondrial
MRHQTKKQTAGLILRKCASKPFLLVPISLFLFTSLVAFSAGPSSYKKSIPPPQVPVNVNLILGNPSGSTTTTSDDNNFLMVKPQYALSFNNSKGGPNWVSWHLRQSDIGTEKRGKFHPDSDLPTSFKHVKKADYNRSGFDRGHLCNSKDRTDTRDNNDATFKMTNILPQAPDNNQGPWARLEDFERSLAEEGNELYIIAGAFGSGGNIAAGKVNVPKVFWKVMVILPEGDNDLSRINDATRAIAVCMPNKQGIRRTDWQTFVTTIRNVEGATHFNFLSELPESVQEAIETRRDSVGIGRVTSNPCQ